MPYFRLYTNVCLTFFTAFHDICVMQASGQNSKINENNIIYYSCLYNCYYINLHVYKHTVTKVLLIEELHVDKSNKK